MSNDDNLKLAVMWHMAAQLPRLRQMTFQERQELMKQCLDVSASQPLHITEFKEKFAVPAWSDEPLTGRQIIALSVGALWVQVGENKEMCSSLYETWYIQDAVNFANLEENKNL